MTAEAQLYSALVRIAAEKGIELDLNADLHIPGRNINLDLPLHLLAIIPANSGSQVTITSELRPPSDYLRVRRTVRGGTT